MAKWSLRTIVPLAAAGCAALLAAKVAGRRRALDRLRLAPDPGGTHLAEEDMGALATAEGMPEASEEMTG